MLADVVAGYSNKEIARRLGISFRTVEVHRANVLRKIGVHTAIELVAIAHACGIDDGGLAQTDPG